MVFGQPKHRVDWGEQDKDPERGPTVVQSAGPCPPGTAPLLAGEAPVAAGSLSEDGELVALLLRGGRTLTVLDRAGRVVTTLPREGIFYAARFLGRDRLVVATSASLDVVALPEGKVVRSAKWDNPASMSRHDAVSPDGKWLLVEKENPARLFVVGLDKLARVATIPLAGRPLTYRFLGDGRRLDVVVERRSGEKGELRLLEIATDTWRTTRDALLPIREANSTFLSSDGRVLVVGSNLVDLTTRAVKKLPFAVLATDERGEVAVARPPEPSWKPPTLAWRLASPPPTTYEGAVGPNGYRYPQVDDVAKDGSLLSCVAGACVLWSVPLPRAAP